MPYDEALAERVRKLVARRQGFAERRLFGGVAFSLHGSICVGVWKDLLIARVGADAYRGALAMPYVREFDITGRPMTGWITIEPAGIADPRDLQEWLAMAIDFVRDLPRKH